MRRSNHSRKIPSVSGAVLDKSSTWLYCFCFCWIIIPFRYYFFTKAIRGFLRYHLVSTTFLNLHCSHDILQDDSIIGALAFPQAPRKVFRLWEHAFPGLVWGSSAAAKARNRLFISSDILFSASLNFAASPPCRDGEDGDALPDGVAALCLHGFRHQ